MFSCLVFLKAKRGCFDTTYHKGQVREAMIICFFKCNGELLRWLLK